MPAMIGKSSERTRKESRDTRVVISPIRYLAEYPDSGIASTIRKMNKIGTTLLMSMPNRVSLNPVFFVMVSPGLSGCSSECVKNHSIGDDDTHNIGYIGLNGSVDDLSLIHISEPTRL